MAGLASVRSPRRHTQQLRLAGKGYRVADEDQAKAAGGRRWSVSVLDTQEVDRTDEFHLPLEYFHEGGGYSFQGLPGTYDYCDGWDASTPSKLSTWPKLTTGQVFEAADSRGWLLYLEPYLYAMRGRFVVKYRPSETSSEWSIIEKHDLGSGNLVAGRPASFKGCGYVPIVDSSGSLQRFHQLTTVATTIVESQTIAISGTPTGGTYTITFDGKTTAAIAYNASAATVQAALRLVAGMELVTVSSTGSTPNFTHTVVMTGVGGALAAASAPQMTSSSSLTGGTPAINHATTVAGTTDTWTQGPANREMRCFVAPWRDKMVGADDYEIRTVSADPMTANDWNPNTTDGISVGNTGSRITDMCVYDYLVLVGKEDGMYSFDEDLRPKNELPDLASIKDENNCVGMTVMGGIVHIPHRAGMVLWAPGTYEFVGPQQEGALEGALTPWGRVSSMAPFGKFAFFAANDAIAQKGIVGSLQPPKGNRGPRVPHYHHVTAAASVECVAVVSSDYLPNPAVTPGTWSDDNAVGTVTWSNTGNASAADGSEASATAGTTHYLKGLNPNPTVPDSATITGVKARIKRRGGKVQFRAVGTPDYVRGTSVVVTNPAAAQVGDLMFVALNLAGVPTVTAPAGWTLLTSQTVGSNIKGYFYYKFKESGDGASWTWTISVTSDVVYGLYAASGVSTSDPFGASAGSAYTSASGPYSGADSPTVTPDGARSLLVCIVGIREGDTTADLTITAPSGMTDRLNHVEYVAGASAARGLAVADLELSSGAATGTKSWTFGTDTAVDAFTFSVTLNPAGDAADNIVKLVKAGSVVGDNKADTSTAWPATAGDAEYGGQNDLWGTTLTAAQVNASDFGIVLSATVNAGTAYVDHIELTIYYTVSGVTEPASFLVVLRVDTDRETVTPDVYKLPRADLAIGNDPTIDRAVTAGADFYSSRLFFPSRNIEKVWRCVEIYVDLEPETNTPGLQVWAAVDNGIEFQLLDANGLAATVRTSGFHRLFFPATSASRGKWVQLHGKVPAAAVSENGVTVDMRGWALRGWYQPTRSEEVVTVVDLSPGERGDYSADRRSAFDALDELIALTEPGANPTAYRDIWGRDGYCRVLEVKPHEVAFKDGQEPGLFATVRMRVALYEN